MRKAKMGLAVLLCICMFMSMMVIYAEGGVTISSLAASIDSNKGVKVEGQISSGIGKQVTIRIKCEDQANAYIYTNQITSEAGGYFKIAYTMGGAVKDVTYQVTVGGDDVLSPASTSFTYVPTPTVYNTITTVNTPTLKVEGNVVKLIPTQTFNKDLGKSTVEIDSSTLTSAFSKTMENTDGTKMVKIEIPEVVGANTNETTMPASFLKSLSETQKIEIASKIASVTLSGNLLNTIQSSDNASKVSLVISNIDKSTLSEEMKNSIGDMPIIDLDIKIDGVSVPWSNKNSSVSVSIPYTPTAEELKNPEHITVWYIDGDKIVAIPSGRYDAEKGTVTFETTHFSKYAVVAVYKTFEDLDSFKWARNAIEVLYAKGITGGTSNKTFSPERKITRAEYVTLLVKTLGLTADVSDNFDDVKPTVYYYEAVGIAKKLGIASGSNNKFMPQAIITRQDMIVLTEHALKLTGKIKSINSTSELDRFKDKKDISDYALNSVASLVREGLIVGSGNNVNPDGSSTRGEAAMLLYKVYNR